MSFLNLVGFYFLGFFIIIIFLFFKFFGLFLSFLINMTFWKIISIQVYWSVHIICVQVLDITKWTPLMYVKSVYV